MRQLPENFFGWNDHKSIMLTKFATLAAAMGCVVMVLCGPRIVSWVLAVHALQLVHGPKLGYFLLGLGYCSAALALWMLYNLYMFWRALKRRGVYPCQRVGPAAHQLVLHLGCSALPAGGCCAGAAVHLCHWRCGGVYGADRAGHQNAFAQAVKMKDELDYTV